MATTAGMLPEIGSLIGGGEWIGRGPMSEVRDPGRHREVVGLVRTATATDVDAVVDAAAQAQVAWDLLGVERRAVLLRDAAAAVEQMGESIAPLLTRENGSILSISARELVMAARVIRFAADNGIEMLSAPQQFTSGDGWARLHRRPVGVVGCIVPWNAPVILTAQKLGPALVAGNAVVVKPSPFAPLAVSLVIRAIAALLPGGVLGAVHGDADAGAALIDHPKVRKVSFTGGAATARRIMRSAADSLTKVHFELGGNDPAIVLEDADIPEVAAKITAQAFRRAGQVCFAIKRVYAPQAMVASLGDAIVQNASAIAIGHGLDQRSTMGPVNNRAQFERITGFLRGLAAEGSRVTVAGEPVDESEWADGYYLRPAIVHDADPSAPIVLEEQFGPILPIVGYRDEEHAIELANGTEYGLGSSVWSADPVRAVAIAERIQAGLTFVNDHGLSELGQRSLPFGGVKESGIGWENSPAGIAEYLDFHSIDVRSATR